MASEKKYFPERKRNKKTGPQGEAKGDESEGDDGDADDLVEARPAGQAQVVDLLDFGNPAATPAGGTQA